jgi:hypothetical protein
MRGIVFDIKDDFVIVLTKSGEFKKVNVNMKETKFEIGSEIDIPMKKSYRHFSALAAALLFFIISVTAYAIYYTPYGYAYVDINPSIKLTFNRFEKIIDALPLNEDGQEVLNGVDINNKNIDSALEEVIYKSREKEYLKENKDNEILITVTESPNSGKIKEEVLKEVNKIGQEINIPVNITLLEVDISTYEEDSKESLGIKKLKEVISEEEKTNDFSVKELLEKNKENDSLSIKAFQNEGYKQKLKDNKGQNEKNIVKEKDSKNDNNNSSNNSNKTNNSNNNSNNTNNSNKKNEIKYNSKIIEYENFPNDNKVNDNNQNGERKKENIEKNEGEDSKEQKQEQKGEKQSAYKKNTVTDENEKMTDTDSGEKEYKGKKDTDETVKKNTNNASTEKNIEDSEVESENEKKSETKANNKGKKRGE